MYLHTKRPYYNNIENALSYYKILIRFKVRSIAILQTILSIKCP